MKSESNGGRYVLEFETFSGFTVGVKPLPPYYLDPIKDAFPLLDMPTHKVTLAAGDVHEYDYVMPDEPPDPDDSTYELYQVSKRIIAHNEKLQKRRNRARRDFCMSVCLEILDGPVSWQEDEWLDRVAAIGVEDFQYPTTDAERRLLFIKTQVLTTDPEVNAVISSSTFQEVDMQGVTDALRGFQGSVVGDAPGRDNDEGQSEEET